MFDLLVNAEGGLTTAGYVVCAIAGIALFVLAILFAGRNSEKKKIYLFRLVFVQVFVCRFSTIEYLFQNTPRMLLTYLPSKCREFLCQFSFDIKKQFFILWYALNRLHQ